MKMNATRVFRNIASLPLVMILAACVAWMSSGRVASAAPARSVAAGKTLEASEPVEKIDINTANADALTSLPGIGKAIAQRILDYRKEHGPFKSIEELVNVRGIGERLLERLRERITAGSRN